MATIFVRESLTDKVGALWLYRDLLFHYGLRFSEVKVCKQLPQRITPQDFLLWEGEAARLPPLPRHTTGQIRSRKSGSFGLVHAHTRADFDLLVSRWDEVEAAAGHLFFAGGVTEQEQGTNDLRWVLDRLVQCHSHSYLRSVDWEKLERGARRRIESADDACAHFQAWAWLFAQLKDGHTKLVRVEGTSACCRVHCGVYGRFVDRHCFLVETVCPQSAAEEADITPGDQVVAVNGCDWPTYLRQEGSYWAAGTAHFRRACWPFMPWYQPVGTCLELETCDGKRTLHFGEESYPGFFHWLYEGRPEPLSFQRLGPDRYRLRIAYFPGDDEFVSCCKEALMAVPEKAELELDLRANGGGNAVTGRKVAGMLLPRGTPLSRHRGRRVGGSFTPWVVCHNEDDPVYLGPLTVMMNELCASATEGVLGALKAAGRAKLVGRRSAGSSGDHRTFLSPGGIRFTCSSWEETTPAGEPIEGHGITTRG